MSELVSSSVVSSVVSPARRRRQSVVVVGKKRNPETGQVAEAISAFFGLCASFLASSSLLLDGGSVVAGRVFSRIFLLQRLQTDAQLFSCTILAQYIF
jgi:hypothetical protein